MEMDNVKLRCHFSIVFESLWQFWLIIVVMLFNEIDSIIEIAEDIGRDGLRALMESGGIWGVLAILLISLIVFGIQFLRWRKTWIILEDNLVIIEKNTLNRKKNTIAVENISAVNMERNLFERIVGTYRIKLDTNSMTTANETDVSIVFREDLAIEFRKTLLAKMNAAKGNTEEPAVSEERQPDQLTFAVASGKKVFHYGSKDMLKHAFYTLPVFSLVIAVLGFGFAGWYIIKFGFISLVRDAMGGFLAVVLLVLGSVLNLVKKFFKYYDFTVYRDGMDLHIRCGLIKLRSYTVPVDKITAFRIEQPLISRIFHKYSMEVITVGVGDEEEESSNITMTLSKEELIKQLKILIPEYTWDNVFDLNREEKAGIKVRIVQSVKWHIATIAAVCIMTAFTDLDSWISIGAPILFDVIIVSLYILSHKAAGYVLMENMMITSSGFLAKHYTVFEYKKMQVLEMDYHPAVKKLGIGNGVVYLLNTITSIPYIKKELASEISEKMIGGTK